MPECVRCGLRLLPGAGTSVGAIVWCDLCDPTGEPPSDPPRPAAPAQPWNRFLDREALDLVWLKDAARYAPQESLLPRAADGLESRPPIAELAPDSDLPVRRRGARRVRPTRPRLMRADPGPEPRVSLCCGATLFSPSGNPQAVAYGVLECGLCGRYVARRNPRTRLFEWLRGDRYDSPDDAP